MDAVQKAREQKDWASDAGRGEGSRRGTGRKTEYDKFWVHELQGVAYANLKQYPEALRELDAAYNSPCMPDADRAARIKLLLQLAYQSKDYPKAVEYGKRRTRVGDPEIGIYLGNAYYIQNDFENTRATMSDVINKLEASGKTPDEPTYRILQSACLQLKDNDCVVQQIEKLVQYHPNPSIGVDMTDACCASARATRNSSTSCDWRRHRRADRWAAVHRDGTARDGTGPPGRSPGHAREGPAEGRLQCATRQGPRHPHHGRSQDRRGQRQEHAEKQDAAARAKPTGDADVKLGAAVPELRRERQGDRSHPARPRQESASRTRRSRPVARHRLPAANNKAEAAKAFQTVTKNPHDDADREVVDVEYQRACRGLNTVGPVFSFLRGACACQFEVG
jgi:tetratricopeptide (TPR) repeat protein